MVWYTLRAETTIKDFYEISKYKIFELSQYTDNNIQHCI